MNDFFNKVVSLQSLDEELRNELIAELHRMKSLDLHLLATSLELTLPKLVEMDRRFVTDVLNLFFGDILAADLSIRPLSFFVDFFKNNGMIDKAIKLMRLTLFKFRGDLKGLMVCSRFFADVGDFEQAVAHYDEALLIFGKRFTAWNIKIGFLVYSRGDVSKLNDLIVKLESGFFLLDNQSVIIGEAYMFAGMFDEAYAYYSENISLIPIDLRLNAIKNHYVSARLSGRLSEAKGILDSGLVEFNHPHLLRKELIVLSRHTNYISASRNEEIHTELLLCCKNLRRKILSEGAYYDLEDTDELSSVLARKKEWGACDAGFKNVFSALRNLYIGKIVGGFSIQPKVKKLFVGGMDWSGSGAVQHYLHEFDQVKQLPGGELQFISGGHGLQKVVKSSGDWKTLANALFDFFQYHVVNVVTPVSNHDAKEAMTSALFLRKIRKTQLLDCFYNFIAQVSCSNLQSSLIEEACRNYINGAIRSLYTFDSNTVYLFDNSIAIFKVDSLVLVDDFVYFGVFRDPRSNYVTRVYLDKSYKKDVAKYVETYRDRRNRFLDGMKLVPKELGDIVGVQFEDFVLSGVFRRGLAKQAGLDLSRQNEYSSFKPWESEKNVYIHRGYDEFELNEISNCLPEYCMEYLN